MALGLFFSALAAERNIPSGYYNALDGKSQEALKTAAKSAISGQKVISYGTSTWNVFIDSDVRSDGTWWDIYSNERRKASSGHGGMNIEHGVANSWWGKTKNEAYKDIHHLFPSDSEANSRKSNYPLGEVEGSPTWTNGVTIIGKPKNGHGGQGGYIYEPADEYKGDNARAYFYMAVRYPDITWRTDNYTSWGIMFRQESYPTLNDWSIELLLRWSREDPVSQKEIDRNEAIYAHQRNRNPFVDFPELAEYIWGNKKGQAFDLEANLKGNVGGGDTPTPPDPTDTPKLIEPTQGKVLDFGQVVAGREGRAVLVLRGENLDNKVPLTVAVYDNSQTDDAGLFAIDGGATQTVSVDAVNSTYGLGITITYNPDRLGEHETNLRIRGGGLKGNTLIKLRGNAIEAPVLTAPRALAPTNVTATSYIANWEPALGDEIDYFIVNRTKYIDGKAETEQIQAHDGEYSLLIEDFCGHESYTVQSVRFGITSPESNSITVGESSISEIEADRFFGVNAVSDGVEITTSATIDHLTVYEANGRTAGVYNSVENGDVISLKRGVYLLRASGVSRPVKVIVTGK
ncbi:MAG: endonuclease [Muribaculaceae bacterium]|nr:endonuclease [Muribaculaceae bacterium]